MAGTVWVVAEGSGGRPAPSALELLTKARELGDRVEAVTWADGAEAMAPELGRHGAVRVHVIGGLGDSLVGARVAAAMAAAMGGAGPAAAPDVVLFPSTYDSRDVAARLSVRLDRPLLANVQDLQAGDPPSSVHAVFGGATLVTARFSGPPPWLFLVRPKSFAPEPLDGAGDPPDVVSLDLPDTGSADGARIVERHVEEREGPKLDEAPVVVSGGRGLGEAGRFAMIEELARLLGGAPGATRAIVDAGWVPYAYQVGQTGKTVKPSVYIACGISGATQHLVGMKGAKNIIAINKDREAPIFAIADLGIVGDVSKVLPRLIESIKARR